MILLNERVVINGNDINIGNIKIPAGDHIQDLSKLAIFLPQSVKLRLSAVDSPHLSLAAFPEFVVVRDKSFLVYQGENERQT